MELHDVLLAQKLLHLHAAALDRQETCLNEVEQAEDDDLVEDYSL